MKALRRAVRTIFRRWKRNAFSFLAVVLGCATLVTILGVTQGSAAHLAERLTALQASHVGAALPRESWESPEIRLQTQLNQLPGVRHGGTLVLPQNGQTVQVATAWSDQGTAAAETIASEGALAARGATLIAGSLPSADQIERDPSLVLVGQAVAKALSISPRHGENLIHSEGRTLTVVGVIADAETESALDMGLIYAPGAAEFYELNEQARTLVLSVEPAYAPHLSETALTALWPQNPGEVTLSVPPSASDLRNDLLGDSRATVLITTAVMIVSAAFSIHTTMQLSVWERRRHIGIDRALGASRRRIALDFTLESAAIGAVGSCAGWCLGILIVAAYSQLNDWQLVFPWAIFTIPAAGMILGALSGFGPALRASKVDPAELLRA